MASINETQNLELTLIEQSPLESGADDPIARMSESKSDTDQGIIT